MSEINKDDLMSDAVEIPQGAAVTTVRSANMPTIYVNNIGFAVSSVEVRLFLGEMLPNADGKAVMVTQRIGIVMTPEYAKVVAESLVQAMNNFEKQFGKVRNIRQQKQTTVQKPEVKA